MGNLVEVTAVVTFDPASKTVPDTVEPVGVDVSSYEHATVPLGHMETPSVLIIISKQRLGISGCRHGPKVGSSHPEH